MYTLADLDAIFTEPQASGVPRAQPELTSSNGSTQQNIDLTLMEPDEILKDVILPPSFDRNNIFDVQSMVDDNFLEVDEIPRDDLLAADEFDVSKFFNLPDNKPRTNKDPDN
ncbi:unnamed protein product [Pieris macdunnoughi]|uniref:Uncharacterized protein n=1 Tax=Pieris macdunnoughi TaxID=345717 RepID=A0A821VYX8_9NEOP|nr:unnamed protein product [Pieris macdunnoughi]